MNRQLNYSGISTKIRAMESTLMKPSMYEEVSYLSTVPEFVSYIRHNTSYGDIFDAVDDTSLHRGQIEQILSLGTYEDFKKIFLFSNQTQRKFLMEYFKTFEIAFIKKCIRSIGSTRPSTSPPIMRDDFFLRHTKLQPVKLWETSNLDELLEALAGTEYYNLLVVRGSSPHMRRFDYETALDQYYFLSIWRSIKKVLPASMSQSLTVTYGSTIDITNILWIYRGLFQYGLSRADLIHVSIPVGHHIHSKMLKSLMEASSPEEFLNLCRGCYYFQHYHISDMSQLEECYNNILLDICSKEAKRDPYSIAIIYSYLFQKDQERRNLIKALECIRYHLEPSEIMRHLNGGFDS